METQSETPLRQWSKISLNCGCGSSHAYKTVVHPKVQSTQTRPSDLLESAHVCVCLRVDEQPNSRETPQLCSSSPRPIFGLHQKLKRMGREHSDPHTKEQLHSGLWFTVIHPPLSRRTPNEASINGSPLPSCRYGHSVEKDKLKAAPHQVTDNKCRVLMPPFSECEQAHADTSASHATTGDEDWRILIQRPQATGI